MFFHALGISKNFPITLPSKKLMSQSCDMHVDHKIDKIILRVTGLKQGTCTYQKSMIITLSTIEAIDLVD